MLLVGGTFNREGGKPSGVVKRMAEALGCHTMNGGKYSSLGELDFTNIPTLIWMPDIDNSERKIVSRLKDPAYGGNPKMLLVSSKSSVGRDFTKADFIGRMLKTRSNLGIYISEGAEKGRYRFSLMDPLGNEFADTENLVLFSTIMRQRVTFMQRLSRKGSGRVGSVKDFEVNSAFLDIVHYAAGEFSKHVNAVNPNRFLGNATTRCMSGFPACRDGGRVLVTRRNVDKVGLSEVDFVEVQGMPYGAVGYYGEHKPSVDTPVQLKLFQYYPNIRYMIHGHAYLKRAEMTRNTIPCGYIEEYNDIVDLYPARNATFLQVNLRGHGCLIASSEIGPVAQAQYVSRPFPESAEG